MGDREGEGRGEWEIGKERGGNKELTEGDRIPQLSEDLLRPLYIACLFILDT